MVKQSEAVKEAAMATTIPAYLDSTHHNDGIEVCYFAWCGQAVKQNPETGRWFITMNHPGFNSPANNGLGYATKQRAIQALTRYGRGR